MLSSATRTFAPRLIRRSVFQQAAGRAMSTAEPNFSAGSETERLTASLTPLLANAGGRWSLTATGEGLERTFKFKTFAKTWASRASGLG